MLNEDIEIGERIRQIRTMKHINQEELATVLDLNKQAISRIEKGSRRISAGELARIADFLKEPVESFTGDLKFKLIHLPKSIVALPKFAIDFLDDYKEFISKEEMTHDAVKLIYDEITMRMNKMFITRFPFFKRLKK